MRCSIDESHCAFECGRFQRAPLHHQPDTSRGLARHRWRPSTTAHALPADQHFGGGCDFLGNQRAYFGILGLFGSANPTVRTRKHEVRPCNVVVDPPPHIRRSNCSPEGAARSASRQALAGRREGQAARKDRPAGKRLSHEQVAYLARITAAGLRPTSVLLGSSASSTATTPKTEVVSSGMPPATRSLVCTPARAIPQKLKGLGTLCKERGS